MAMTYAERIDRASASPPFGEALVFIIASLAAICNR
jgi:hypothetical protein